MPNFNFNYNFPAFSQSGSSETFFEKPAFADFFRNTYPILKFLKAHLFWIIFATCLLFVLILILQILGWLSKPALIKLVQLKETQDKNPSLIEGLEWGQKYLFRYVLAGWSLWFPYLILMSIPVIGMILSLLMHFKNVSHSLIFFFLFLFLLLIIAFLSIPFSLLTELVHRKVVIEEKKVFEAIKEGIQMFLKEWQKVVFVWLISIVVSFVFGLLLLIATAPIFFLFIGSAFFTIFFKAKGVKLLLFIAVLSLFFLVFTLISLFFKAITGTLLTNYWTLTYLEIQKTQQAPPQPSLPLEPKT